MADVSDHAGGDGGAQRAEGAGGEQPPERGIVVGQPCYPGSASFLVDAVRTGDAPVVEGIALLLTVAVVTSFLAADLVVILTKITGRPARA